MAQDTNGQDAAVEHENISNHPLDQPAVTGLGHQSISAADYNPDDDRRLDDERQQERQEGGLKASVAARPSDEVKTHPEPAITVKETVEEETTDEDDEEEDEDDMFAIGTVDKTKKAKARENGHLQANDHAPFLPVRFVIFIL